MKRTKFANKLWLAALLVALLAALLCLSVSAETVSGTCGAAGDGSNLTWTLDTETGELTISGTGAMEDYAYNVEAPWDSYSSLIKTATIENDVTSIGRLAFYNCCSLESVIIPEGVEIYDDVNSFCPSTVIYCYEDSPAKIYADAYGRTFVTLFGHGVCGESLTWKLISDGELIISGTGAMENYTHWLSYTPAPWSSYRSAISKISMEDGITRIGDWAFLECSMTDIVIPNSVTSMGEQVFSLCKNLISVTISENVTSISADAFTNCTSLKSVIIPDGVKSIGYEAFFNCSALEFVSIPDSVTSIGDYAFESCDSLTYNFYDNAKYLGNEENPYVYLAKASNTSIISCEINSKTKVIASYAFKGCNLLTQLFIPDGVTCIGNYAFEKCDSLAYNVHANAKYLGSTENPYIYLAKASNTCEINSKTKFIGDAAFAGCDSLTSLTIPDSVTSIGNSAFYSCDNLTNVTIPVSVTSIGKWTFESCPKLKSVTIPMSVISIYEDAFKNCSNLTSIIIMSDKVSIDNSPNTIPKSAIIYAQSGSTAEEYAKECSRTFVKFLYRGACGVNWNNITWALSEDGKLFISGTGEMIDYMSPTNIPWYSYLKSIKTATIENGVTNICNYAFYNCDELTSVTIGNGVTGMGTQVFYNCNNLATIVVDESNPVYHSEGNCIIETTSKTLIAGCKNSVIPADGSVTSIGYKAFGGCSDLTSVTIPDSVTSIHSHAFEACSNLASVTIPDSVTLIGNGAFFDCSSLTNLTIGSGVTKIDANAFNACSKLISVTIPNSATSIEAYAFKGCSKLTQIIFLSKTVEIRDREDTISSTAVIYGYADSTAEAYATKYNRTFVVLEEPKIDASLISYQVSKNTNGTFSLRAIAGLNSLDYKNFGYEITVTTKDASGNDVVQTVSGTDYKAYSSIYGGDTAYSIKEHFGYEYASLATLTGLAIDSTYTKIEIRSYVTAKDGTVTYGNGATLLYEGLTNEDGFPALTVVTE